ncbi:vacuolar protein-sorting-associated protein 37 homolog 1-like [Punica granatum]|uniref:Uncharacterized protein n=2 Tax=Punica granatum TaxID=22663 RepID=A0A2I0JMZ1_PUNGR|nr:vacuolar protein-sorting-associated protein 37 homolog 1-like [Punica granatum]PKI57644.1 hypothetical protein CRG98_021972 [Punica granatum]
MFRFWGSQEQQEQSRAQDSSSPSWYPPSVGSSPTSSRPSTPGSSSHGSFSLSSHTTSHVSPSEASGIINQLKDKSVDELRKLLSDEDAYNQFLLSLDQVKMQNNLRDELRNETLQLARNNLEKEPQIMELRNQCRIIRTTELAAAQEKLNELEKRKEETMKSLSPSSFLQKLQEAMNKTEEDSEALHRQLLEHEIELGAFVQKYKKLRNIYHRRALIHLAARASSTG